MFCSCRWFKRKAILRAKCGSAFREVSVIFLARIHVIMPYELHLKEKKKLLKYIWCHHFLVHFPATLTHRNRWYNAQLIVIIDLELNLVLVLEMQFEIQICRILFNLLNNKAETSSSKYIQWKSQKPKFNYSNFS